MKVKTYKDANEALKDYKYAPCVEIIKRIEDCDFVDERESADIINEIVLWKINRQTKIENTLLRDIKDLSNKVKTYDDVKNPCNKSEIERIYKELTETQGIKAAMASTILKMFMPEALPIIDQRAYREIFKNDMPKKVCGKEYLDYVDAVIARFVKENAKCSTKLNFSDIDKVLYQIDKATGKKVNY